MNMVMGRALVTNKYLHLLTVMLFVLLCSPFLDRMHPKIPAITIIFLASLMFVLRTLKIRRVVFFVSAAIGVLVLVLQFMVNLSSGAPFAAGLNAALCLAYAIFSLICILLMSYKIFESSRVTVDTIGGGIDVYMLLGFLWMFLYYLIYCLDPQAFHYSTTPSITYFLYFSFSTLTTIGFGDVFPINKWAMILACLEGIVGQLYLAIYIARLVGLYTTERTEFSK